MCSVTTVVNFNRGREVAVATFLASKITARHQLRFVLVPLLHMLTSQLRTHTHSSVSRTDSCSHHHLTDSWWLQKKNSEQQSSTFHSHRLSESPFNNSCITVQCNVGFLLNTFSQLPIIPPYKTTADCIGGLFYPPITPRPFVSENMFQLNATKRKGERV